jgi:hypothetical protein
MIAKRGDASTEKVKSYIAFTQRRQFRGELSDYPIPRGLQREGPVASRARLPSSILKTPGRFKRFKGGGNFTGGFAKHNPGKGDAGLR